MPCPTKCPKGSRCNKTKGQCIKTLKSPKKVSGGKQSRSLNTLSHWPDAGEVTVTTNHGLKLSEDEEAMAETYIQKEVWGTPGGWGGPIDWKFISKNKLIYFLDEKVKSRKVSGIPNTTYGGVHLTFSVEKKNFHDIFLNLEGPRIVREINFLKTFVEKHGSTGSIGRVHHAKMLAHWIKEAEKHGIKY